MFIDAQKKDKLNLKSSILIFILLLFAALSKEFGLAFISVIAVISLTASPPWKLRTALLITFLVAVTYFSLRFGVAKSFINQDYCEYIGYRTESLRLCYNEYDFTTRIKFYLWNMGSTFIGIFYPMLFSGEGQWLGFQVQESISASYFEIGFSVLLTALVGLSLIKVPRKSLPFFALILSVSVLSFVLYRRRNHLIGLFGLYTLFGIGISCLWALVKGRQSQRILFSLILILLCFIIGSRSMDFSQYLDRAAASYSELDPCESAITWHNPEIFDMDIIKQIKINYKMSNPTCQLAGWKTWRLKSMDITK